MDNEQGRKSRKSPRAHGNEISAMVRPTSEISSEGNFLITGTGQLTSHRKKIKRGPPLKLYIIVNSR